MTRVIPCLDVRDGKVVKGVNFQNIKEVGEVEELARKYADQGVEQILILDINASNENRRTRVSYLERLRDLGVELVIGGGIASLEDVRWLLSEGASKVTIGSAAVRRPQLVKEIIGILGSEVLVLSADAGKDEDGNYYVHVDGGATKTDLELVQWCRSMEERGVKELLLTSIDKDGTRSGYDLDMYSLVSEATDLEIIASGGAGSLEDMVEASKIEGVKGVLAASLFHIDEVSVEEVQKALW